MCDACYNAEITSDDEKSQRLKQILYYRDNSTKMYISVINYVIQNMYYFLSSVEVNGLQSCLDPTLFKIYFLCSTE